MSSFQIWAGMMRLGRISSRRAHVWWYSIRGLCRAHCIRNRFILVSVTDNASFIVVDVSTARVRRCVQRNAGLGCWLVQHEHTQSETDSLRRSNMIWPIVHDKQQRDVQQDNPFEHVSAMPTITPYQRTDKLTASHLKYLILKPRLSPYLYILDGDDEVEWGRFIVKGGLRILRKSPHYGREQTWRYDCYNLIFKPRLAMRTPYCNKFMWQS